MGHKGHIRPLYIFDIDGVLADCTHRLHHLETTDKDRWDRFYAECDKDVPMPDVIKTLAVLWSTGADIKFITGRRESVRDVTAKWLGEHTVYSSTELDEGTLLMRSDGDWSSGGMFKSRKYATMAAGDRERLVGVFEDTQAVVDMWWSLGVTVFQVAPPKKGIG